MRSENNQKTASVHRKQLFQFGLLAAFLLLISGLLFLRPTTLLNNTLTSSSVAINGHTIYVDVADEPTERTQGLSGRDELKEKQGMLFVFDRPTIPAFWMKDMNFPIDVIWINEDGTIVGIEDSVLPESFPRKFSPAEKVKYVLEVNAGYSEKHQISPGESVKINLNNP